MIVDGFDTHWLDDNRVARTATVRRDDGTDAAVTVVVPEEFAPAEPDDATGPLPLMLLIAMRVGEDLELRGHVDPELLERTDDIQRYYLACAPGLLHPVDVRSDGPLPPDGPRSPFAAACISRGVDSLYQAARRRSAAGPLDALVFIDRFEPIHDNEVRSQERELAREAAGLIGLPLLVAEVPVRGLSEPFFDWEDAVGAGIAWAGHALSGGLGRLVIPATDSIQSIAPCGHGPGLDPLFSSSRIWFEPGDISESRMGKVAWLTRHCPELLPLLKVCYAANRSDNCGRCGKCMQTMACLRAAGALEEATGFPPALDLDAFASVRHGTLSEMTEMAMVRDAAEAAGDDALASAAEAALRLSVRSHRVADAPSFRTLQTDATRTMLRHGVRDAAPRRWGRHGRSRAAIGLVRAIDLRGRRHLHGAGWRPPGSITAELGALWPEGMDSDVPLWVLADGRIATLDVTPAGADPGLGARLAHAFAPMRLHSRAGAAQPATRRAMRRVLDLAVAQPLRPAVPDPGQRPHGYLSAEGGESLIPLWAGDHQVTGDQYTAANAEEILSAGYAAPRLLGYLDPSAPLTGRLGVHATPIIPWA
jgi:hypothetical protein